MAVHKLGKKPATYSPRDLRFADYLHPDFTLFSVPASFGYGFEIGDDAWRMLGNGPDDSVQPGFEGAGDCVFAGGDHETMLVNRIAGHPVPRFDGASAISDYSAVTGYVLGDPSTDHGTSVRDAMAYRQKTGLLDADGNRHKIGAYLALEPGNEDHLFLALYLFGIAGIGLQLPVSAHDQFDAGRPWSVVPGSPIDDGHYVPLVSRRPAGPHCVSWGRNVLMTTGFYRRYCDEAWAIVSPELLNTHGRTMLGFDLDGLLADLNSL